MKFPVNIVSDRGWTSSSISLLVACFQNLTTSYSVSSQFLVKIRNFPLQTNSRLAIAPSPLSTVLWIRSIMAHENHQPQDHGHHHSSFFLSGSAPCSIIVFIIGAGLNLRLFQHYGIPIERIFNIPGHEFPSGQELVRSGSHLFVIFIALFGWYKIHLIDYVRPEFVTVFICGGLVSLLCLPLDVWKLKLRQRLVRTLGKCLWPYDRIGSGFIWPTSDVPFFHTFFADGLTSLSKMFKDITIALLMVCQDETSTGYQNRMKHHPLPHFIAACPYLIRMQQCTINYRLARTSTERSLHVLNIVKYVSGVLVIGVGAMPLIFTHWEILPPEDGMVFLICACFNSLYSFVWDIVVSLGVVFHYLKAESNI